MSYLKKTKDSFAIERKLKMGPSVTALLLLCFLFPQTIFAQGNLITLMGSFMTVIDGLVLIVLALGLLFFLWGMAKFILKADNEVERAKGKQVMIWGLIALFVMVSVWGIIGFFQGEIFGGGIPDAKDFLDF